MIGPAYLVMFHRLSAPNVEVCPGIDMDTVVDAIAITERYRAPWGDVRQSACTTPPAVNEVRIQFDEHAPGDRDHPGSTHTEQDANGNATTSVITIVVFHPTSKLIAHELSHAQGIDHICEHTAPGPMVRCPSVTNYPDDTYSDGTQVFPIDETFGPAYLHLDMVGSLMYPDKKGQGLDLTGMHWAIRHVYDDASSLDGAKP